MKPAEVARRAARNGVQLWALTDHDEMAGLAEARAAAAELGMRFVNGVEVSVTWAQATIHIVGLNVDPDNATLVQGLASTRSGRDARAREIGDRLARLGIAGAYQGALRLAANPALVGRAHFARYLVEQGHCDGLSGAFERYLGEGKPAYQPFSWATLSDALRWIDAAGGTAVIAHPARYALGDTGLDALVGEFKDLGGRGIEVVSGAHLPADYPIYGAIATRHGLFASRGSDFHGPDEGRAELGQLPDLPSGLKPVWQLF